MSRSRTPKYVIGEKFTKRNHLRMARKILVGNHYLRRQLDSIRDLSPLESEVTETKTFERYRTGLTIYYFTEKPSNGQDQDPGMGLLELVGILNEKTR